MEVILNILWFGSIGLLFLGGLRLVLIALAKASYKGSREEMFHLMQGKRRNFIKSTSNSLWMIAVGGLVLLAFAISNGF